jgi:hypothetical protein
VRGQDDRYRVLVAVPMARRRRARSLQWVLALLVPAVLPPGRRLDRGPRTRARRSLTRAARTSRRISIAASTPAAGELQRWR